VHESVIKKPIREYSNSEADNSSPQFLDLSWMIKMDQMQATRNINRERIHQFRSYFGSQPILLNISIAPRFDSTRTRTTMSNQAEDFTRSHEATDHEIATSDVPSLSGLFIDNPTLQIFTPSMPGFSALRSIYSVNVTSSPLAIVRPKTSVDITTIVKYTVKNKIPISVRVGGHDMFGRSMPHDTLVIDIRNLNHFTLLLDESAALIGGGIIQSELISKLALTGHTTPFASAPSVGYAGWATLGGYGLLSGAFGLGVDQIIGATLINDKGDIVEANSEMLFALRGGGGSIGIIIAMKIRVYKLPTVSFDL
jgi:hypothetical protein